MTIAESTQTRLVLQSGGATLSLDKSAKQAELQRKGFLWKPKPMTEPLANVSEITVDAGVDRASGVEICNTMIVFRNGMAWAFGANDRAEAQENAKLMRNFLGLH